MRTSAVEMFTLGVGAEMQGNHRKIDHTNIVCSVYLKASGLIAENLLHEL